MKKVFIYIGLSVLIIILIFLLLSKDSKSDKNTKDGLRTNPSAEIIFFYGDGCPHCAVVEKYIKDNGVDQKIDFQTKEVYYNKANAEELGKKAEACGINTNEIGVPFLWDGSKCLIGDQDIVDFFKTKIKEDNV
jgi:glutaredoxin